MGNLLSGINQGAQIVRPPTIVFLKQELKCLAPRPIKRAHEIEQLLWMDPQTTSKAVRNAPVQSGWAHTLAVKTRSVVANRLKKTC